MLSILSWFERRNFQQILLKVQTNKIILCVFFSDICRQNAFQVIAVDGVCSGIILCLSAEDCLDWLQAIATNISSLTKHNVSTDLRAWHVCVSKLY